MDVICAECIWRKIVSTDEKTTCQAINMWIQVAASVSSKHYVLCTQPFTQALCTATNRRNIFNPASSDQHIFNPALLHKSTLYSHKSQKLYPVKKIVPSHSPKHYGPEMGSFKHCCSEISFNKDDQMHIFLWIDRSKNQVYIYAPRF